MPKTKIALALSAMPDTPPQTIIDLSKSAEDNGFAGVFMTEAGNDSLAYCIGVGAHTRTLKLGTAITNIYLRHPALLANEAAAVQEFTGGRFILGLGTGHREMNTILGIEMGEPMAKMREVVATLRKVATTSRILAIGSPISMPRMVFISRCPVPSPRMKRPPVNS